MDNAAVGDLRKHHRREVLPSLSSSSMAAAAMVRNPDCCEINPYSRIDPNRTKAASESIQIFRYVPESKIRSEILRYVPKSKDSIQIEPDQNPYSLLCMVDSIRNVFVAPICVCRFLRSITDAIILLQYGNNIVIMGYPLLV